MKPTDRTLLDQMHITEFELESRKTLCSFTREDVQALLSVRAVIEKNIDGLVELFYQSQTSIAEIAMLIGDADTLDRLKRAQRRYILDLFSGIYDLDYVQNRLRIGLVHKRSGVEPKLYLSAVHLLKGLLHGALSAAAQSPTEREYALDALDKLLFIDITLVFETYIRSLVSEIETAKTKSDLYATTLEEKVRERTRQLEELSQTDSLTGLLNVRTLQEVVTRVLRSAQRRAEPVSVVYIDVDDFKAINDTQGHQRGDEILCLISRALKRVSRAEDSCFRYGGDEFCVVLANCLSEHATERFIVRLNAILSTTLPGVTLSTGVAQTGPSQYLTATALIDDADKRMFNFKQVRKLEQGLMHQLERASGDGLSSLVELH